METYKKGVHMFFTKNRALSKETEQWIVIAIVFNMALNLVATSFEILLLDLLVSNLIEPVQKINSALKIIFSVFY